MAEFPPAHTDGISFPSGLSFSLLLLPMNFPLLFMLLDVNVMGPTYPRRILCKLPSESVHLLGSTGAIAR